MTKKSVTRYILGAMFALFLPLITYGQGGNLGSSSSPIINRYGQGIAGVNIAFCQPLSTTAATVTSNVAILTMSSNPITVGFVVGMTIQVAGFTGGDTYFNGGTFSGSSITSGYTIMSVTTTTITYSLTHANASASSNGTVLQMGNVSTSCAGKSTVYSNPTLATTTTNPIVSDNQGNWNVFAAPGLYYVQFYGTGITTTLRQITIACVPTGTCTTLSPLVIPGLTSGGLSVTSPAIGGSAALQLGVTGNGTAQATFPAATDTVVELTQNQIMTNKGLTSPTTTGTDSGTETQNNKTFTAASNGNVMQLLDNQAPTAALTGDGTNKTIFTYTIPANTVGAGKGVKVCAFATHSAGAANVAFLISLGATGVHAWTDTAGTATVNGTCAEIITSPGVQNAARSMVQSIISGSTLTVGGVTVNIGENFANALTVKFTFNVAATDQVTGTRWSVQLIN